MRTLAITTAALVQGLCFLGLFLFSSIQSQDGNVTMNDDDDDDDNNNDGDGDDDDDDGTLFSICYLSIW